MSGLNAFAEQFRAQVGSSGLPASEHAVHFCLALGLQAAWALPPGAIVFERPSRSGTRVDLWVREPYDLADTDRRAGDTNLDVLRRCWAIGQSEFRCFAS